MPFAPINSQLNDDNIGGASKEGETVRRGCGHKSHQFSYQIPIRVGAGMQYEIILMLINVIISQRMSHACIFMSLLTAFLALLKIIFEKISRA